MGKKEEKEEREGNGKKEGEKRRKGEEGCVACVYTCRSTSILSKLFNKLLSTLSPHLWWAERGEKSDKWNTMKHDQLAPTIYLSLWMSERVPLTTLSCTLPRLITSEPNCSRPRSLGERRKGREKKEGGKRRGREEKGGRRGREKRKREGWLGGRGRREEEEGGERKERRRGRGRPRRGRGEEGRGREGEGKERKTKRRRECTCR